MGSGCLAATDMSCVPVKWQGEAPALLSRAGASYLVGWPVVVSVSLATRGQTDMRGLFTAGRGFGRSGFACLGASVALEGCS